MEFTGRENGGNDFLHNATELKACFIGCTHTHRLHGTRLTSSRQVYVDFLVKSEWSSEFMNEL